MIFPLLFLAGCQDSGAPVFDEMYTDTVKDSEFFVFRSHDTYYKANGEVNSIEFAAGVEPILLENGEFAVITGDADILNGGIAGYLNKPYIKKIRSQEKLTLEGAIERFEIPELENNRFSYDNKIFKYTSGSNIFIIFQNGAPYGKTFDIYKNSQFLTSYEGLNEADDIAAFIESINTPDIAE